ncbi:MAG: hypothetical protein Roseis2KO_28400 [Roseivirga sp.]
MKKLLIAVLLIHGFTNLAQERPDSTFVEFLSLFPGKNITPSLQESILGIEGPFPEERSSFEQRTAQTIVRQTDNYILASVRYTCIAGGMCESTELYSFSKQGEVLGNIQISKDMGDCGFSDSAETAYFESDEILVVDVSKEFDCEADSVIYEKVAWHYYKIDPDGHLSMLRSKELKTEELYRNVSIELLKEEDLKQLSVEQLAKMRNTVFATYGYRFKTTKWLTYFEKQAWYKPSTDIVTEENLNPIERINMALIKRVEYVKKKG